MQKVEFISKLEAEKINYKISKHPCLISIFERKLEPPVITENVWDNILKLQFHDIDINDINEKFHERTVRKYTLFNEDHARQILFFLKDIESTCDTLIIHCHAGISRSAAIAKFVAEEYNLRFSHNYPLYNKTVYNILRKVKYGPVDLNVFKRMKDG